MPDPVGLPVGQCCQWMKCMRYFTVAGMAFPECLGAAVLLHGYVEMPLWERLRGGRSGS